jgi:putative transcriptional regulator
MRVRALAILLLCSAAAASGAALHLAPVPPSRPHSPSGLLAQGKFLIASRQVGGPYFAESVVLLLEYSAHGAVGLIINRPTEIELGHLLPELEGLEGRSDRTYFGGPVSRGELMLLIRSSEPPPRSHRIVDDIHASGSLETLRELLGTTTPANRFHAYLGYAGWGARQLDGEVARGDWYIVPAESDTVFDKEAGEIWPELIRSSAGRWVQR